MEWISVKIDYPAFGDKVLCLDEDKLIFVGEYGGCWYSRNHDEHMSFWVSKEITHWMPLPMAPKD
jgi:uncharacterized protein DUF551